MAAGKSELFFSDLDGTLIFSAKRKHPEDVVVEVKNGEEITCITPRQAELLPLLSDRIIPLTSRSVEQYSRIRIDGFSPRYALCSNGAVLLVDGVPDEEWLARSRELFGRAEGEIERFRGLLEKDENRSFEIRLVDGLFLFTKSTSPEKTLERLDKCGGELCDCFATGEKVYVIPKSLGKGEAVKRFAKRFPNNGEITCAGDSLMDLSMLNCAETAVFTENIPEERVTSRIKIIRPRENFTEFLTEYAKRH